MISEAEARKGSSTGELKTPPVSPKKPEAPQ